MTNDQTAKEEPADVYGRQEGCFLDYKKAPFRFKDVARSLEPTHLLPSRTDSSGLVTEPGLQVGSFPNTSILLDEPFEMTAQDGLLDFTKDIGKYPGMVSPFFSRTTLLEDLQLPLESPDLKSDPATDLDQYRQTVEQTRFGDPFMQWLPLSPTKDEEDEGLRFPAKAGRLYSLLLRELDCERIEVSSASRAWEKDIQDSLFAKAPPMPFERFGRKAKQIDAEVLTPPMSPISEDSNYTPYEPDPKVFTIDLTSEPSSPVMPEVLCLENSIQDGTIESDPPTYEGIVPTSSSASLPGYSTKATVSLKDLELDVPLPSTAPSSVNSSKKNALKRPGLLDNLAGSDTLSSDGPLESFFDDAFTSTLEARQSNATNMTEQERLDPIDSSSRISVTFVNFTIDKAEWTEHTTTPMAHFIWIQGQQISEHNLAPMPRSVISDSSLKWAPFTPGVGRVSTDEALEELPEQARRLLIHDPTPELNSGDYVRHVAVLSIELLGEEQELEAEVGLEEKDESLRVTQDNGYVESSHFRGRSGKAKNESQNRQTEDEALYGQFKGESSDLSLGSLVSAAASKRRRAQTTGGASNMLPSSNDAEATSKLLEGFLELRATKRPRLVSSTISSTCVASSRILKSSGKGSSIPPAPVAPDEPEILIPAPAPEAIIPEEKGCFIISLSLGRSILRRIESSWPQDHLIDRDYSLHKSYTRSSPGRTQRQEITSTLSSDADIALTPTVGMIATTLPKAKQKQLPKSTTLPQLRNRILEVGQKYETLYVLVSECNPSGEYTSKLHPSDAAAYADFVRFTTSIGAGVSTCFVPGADQTMAKWILSLMCQYTPHALSNKPYLNSVESTWEVFFRRAGMNAFAAQVLAGAVLEKGGNEGLARLMASSPDEVVGTFGYVLGGKKGLTRLSEMLCKPWANLGREMQRI